MGPQTCPVCKSPMRPLFHMEVFCPHCDRTQELTAGTKAGNAHACIVTTEGAWLIEVWPEGSPVPPGYAWRGLWVSSKTWDGDFASLRPATFWPARANRDHVVGPYFVLLAACRYPVSREEF